MNCEHKNIRSTGIGVYVNGEYVEQKWICMNDSCQAIIWISLPIDSGELRKEVFNNTGSKVILTGSSYQSKENGVG